MPDYVYIHGFNGHCKGQTAGRIALALGAGVICLGYDYSQPFEECLGQLEQKAMAAAKSGPLHVLAVSLGAFYALQLRQTPVAAITAWNPVVFPALQLEQFLGANTRFVDGHKWTFTEGALYSYTHAPDARQWDNFYFQKIKPGRRDAPKRNVILGRQDLLLDARLTENYWQGHAAVSWIDSGHDVQDFGHLRGI